MTFKKKVTLKKQIAKVAKTVNALVKKDTLHEYGGTSTALVVPNIIGIADTNTIDNVFRVVPLTTLQQAGDIGQARIKESAEFQYLNMTYHVGLTGGVQFADIGGNGVVRAFVLKIKQMPDDGGGTYRLPTVKEIFLSGGTLDESDMYMKIKRPLVTDNYSIVYDKFIDVSVYSHKIGGVHKLHVKVPKGTLSTYDGPNNNIADCSQNHYVFCIGSNISDIHGGVNQPRFNYFRDCKYLI